MEIKLHVNIGATLQVKNAKGEWDWIKPEVGAELKLIEGEVQREFIQDQFGKLWDNIVGPQFASVVKELINEQVTETPEEFKQALFDAADDDAVVYEYEEEDY